MCFCFANHASAELIDELERHALAPGEDAAIGHALETGSNRQRLRPPDA
jgi:hypothetical protein